jgi:hypothetical protein
MSNGRCRPGLLAVARTHGRCSPAVRLPGIGARFFITRLSQLSSQAADQNASVLRDFDCAQWCSPARSRSRKVHQPLLRGGIGRARALREGAVSVAAVAARRHPASPARRQTGNVSGFNDGSCFGVQFDAEPRLACIVVWAPTRVELAPSRASVSRRGISC